MGAIGSITKAAAVLGRRGGSAKSAAKAEAARKNGNLGGRPRSDVKRCVCGAMTAQRAEARGHRCG